MGIGKRHKQGTTDCPDVADRCFPGGRVASVKRALDNTEQDKKRHQGSPRRGQRRDHVNPGGNIGRERQKCKKPPQQDKHRGPRGMGDAQDFGAGNEFTAIPEGQGGRAGGVIDKKGKYSDTPAHGQTQPIVFVFKQLSHMFTFSSIKVPPQSSDTQNRRLRYIASSL